MYMKYVKCDEHFRNVCNCMELVCGFGLEKGLALSVVNKFGTCGWWLRRHIALSRFASRFD
jgi:hypothetical protein